MSRLRIFAGPNGSGKSTLFRQVASRFKVGAFVNADLIEQELIRSGLIDLSNFHVKASEEDFEAFKSSAEAQSLMRKAEKEGLQIDISIRENFIVDKSKLSHSYESALVAMFLRQILISGKKGFSYETVMSHPSKVTEIRTALDAGYRPYLYFVCTDDPIVNIQRVENRVEKGGHPVLSEKILSRYEKSLQNVFPAMSLCYRSYLFDNSGAQMTLVAEVHAGALLLHTNKIPNWFSEYILRHFVTTS
ncbi:zeta toxin family protein [Rurimicrobium arvi]|uniref:Zeta toxin family protein n=1 Tax=Rurimicrobium arvi TaxID=2049916 RepID=A0ABP8MNG1_9BACT